MSSEEGLSSNQELESQELLQEEQSPEFAEFVKLSAVELTDGSLWHVVAKSWLSNWKEFVHGNLQSSPGPISNSDVILRLYEDSCYIDPRPRKSYTNVALMPEVLEGRDYEVLPNEAYKYLVNKYGTDDTEIKRFATALNDDGSISQVEVHLKQINVVVYPHPLGEHPIIKKMQMLRREYVDTLKEKVSECSGIDAKLKSRIWKLEAPVNLEALLRLKRGSSIPGSTLLKERKQELEDAEIADDDVVLVEYINPDGEWSFTSGSLESCVHCRKIGELLVCTGCKTVKYCSTSCQSAHYKSHKELCKKLSRIKNKTNGQTGLHNLGNTCFMNSALQCLSHTVELTNYFLEGRFSADINSRNPIGTGGALANAYAELVSDLWLSNKESVSPWKFKKTISKFAPQFSGFAQHDSQELLSYVLDGLHEDLNLVKQKPYIQDAEVDLRKSDQQLSEESWERHLSRNRSIIVDLMHGQCKSTLVCPECERVSVTFDPFLSYNLQIPNKESAKLSVYFVSLDRKRLPLKLSAELTMSSRLGDFRSLLQPVINCEFIWVIMYKNRIQQFPSDTFELSELRYCLLFAFETPADLAAYVTVPLIVTKKGEKGLIYSSFKTEVAFTQLLFLKPEDTLKEVYVNVLGVFQSSIEQLELLDITEANVSQVLQLKLCSINIVNNSSKLTRNSKKKLPCEFCAEINCTNCPLPLSDAPLREILSRTKSSNDRFSLEVEWVSSIKDFKRFSFFEEHDTILKPATLSGNKVLTLQDCFELTSRPEKLDRDNTWFCSNCKKQVEAIKTYRLFRLPRILILHLKRFRSRGQWSEKIASPVDFPLKGLDLSEFVLGENRAVYDLFAVSNHFGGLGGGHYTAYVSSAGGEWYEMDDSSVSRTDRVVTAAAYVLFYRRRS